MLEPRALEITTLTGVDHAYMHIGINIVCVYTYNICAYININVNILYAYKDINLKVYI